MNESTTQKADNSALVPTQQAAPVAHAKVIDPVADMLRVYTLISEADRIKEWLQRYKSAAWTIDEAADSAIDAFHLAAHLELSAFTVVRRDKSGPVSLVQMVYRALTQAGCTQPESKEIITDAITESDISTEGVVKSRLNVPTIYYDRYSGKYWHTTDDGKWQAVKDADAAKLLVAAGMSRMTPPDLSLTEVDQHMLNIRNENGIDWAGPLAGYRAGLQEMQGNRILVTSSFNLIEPHEGEWPVIYEILNGMLGEDQFQYFCATLKIFYEALRDNRGQQGQMMILCGPKDCLKSFVQHHIITLVWGGRSADASRYLSGRTEFNSELCGAEHVFLDDAKPYGNWLSRHDYAENLKSIIVGKTTSLHGKHKTAINVNIRCRITMSINDDETSLRSMPHISESFEDKVHLFHCRNFKLPMPNQTADEKTAFDAAVKAELPAFVYSLLNWSIPQDLLGVRFGVKHFHDPQLVGDLQEMTDEAQLDELIENVSLNTSNGLWTGSAVELHSQLISNFKYGKQAAKLLAWNNATGSLLGRLAKQKPSKYEPDVHKIGGKSTRRWIIRPENGVECSAK